mgnify:CR=1 FL=1
MGLKAKLPVAVAAMLMLMTVAGAFAGTVAADDEQENELSQENDQYVGQYASVSQTGEAEVEVEDSEIEAEDGGEIEFEEEVADVSNSAFIEQTAIQYNDQEQEDNWLENDD